MEKTGAIATKQPGFPDAEFEHVIRSCWAGTVAMQSNFARDHAWAIAACASSGFITTMIFPGIFNGQWLPTPVGLEWVSERGGEPIF